MPIQLNSSGMPFGTGSLQVRGCVYWAIYADETGRKIQMNTGTDDFAEARRVLANTAITVLQARLAALREIRDERPPQGKAGAHPRRPCLLRVARKQKAARKLTDGKEAPGRSGDQGKQPADHGARQQTRRRSVRGNSEGGGNGKRTGGARKGGGR